MHGFSVNITIRTPQAAGEVPAAYSPRSSIHQTDNSPHARVQIVLVGTGDLGRNRALAYAEEGSKQEFIVGLGAVLRIGSDRIIVPEDYCLLGLEKVRD